MLEFLLVIFATIWPVLLVFLQGVCGVLLVALIIAIVVGVVDYFRYGP